MKADCASQGDGLGDLAGSRGVVGELSRGSGDSSRRRGGGGGVGMVGGHAWLAVASVVSLMLRPSRHPCQH